MENRNTQFSEENIPSYHDLTKEQREAVRFMTQQMKDELAFLDREERIREKTTKRKFQLGKLMFIIPIAFIMMLFIFSAFTRPLVKAMSSFEDITGYEDMAAHRNSVFERYNERRAEYDELDSFFENVRNSVENGN